MANPTLPTNDRELDDFAANIVSEVSTAPEDYGTNAARVAQCGAKRVTFDVNLTATLNPATRTPVAIVAKNEARAALVADLRELIRIIEACPTVTDEMRRSLGINIRKSPAPIPAPAEAPRIDVERATGHSVAIRLHATGDRRGRPVGTMGANLYTYVGASAPTREEDWKMLGNTNRTRLEVGFDQSLAPGTTVWITARWYNQRTQMGPMAAPVSTNLPGSGAVSGAQQGSGDGNVAMRVAA